MWKLFVVCPVGKQITMTQDQALKLEHVKHTSSTPNSKLQWVSWGCKITEEASWAVGSRLLGRAEARPTSHWASDVHCRGHRAKARPGINLELWIQKP